MKKVVIYFIYFLFILPVFAQGILVEMTEEEIIDQKLASYISILNSQVDQSSMTYIYKLKNISIQDTTATVICDIIIMGDTVAYLQNENIELVKNYEWKINYQSLGEWAQNIFNIPTIGQQIASTSSTTIETFDIRLSENTLINVPFHGDIYEINSTLTMNEINGHLFSDNSEMDGAILYLSPDANSRAAFITDRKWRRIVYASTSSNNIKAFNGSSECPLLIPVAIAVHTNSNIVFVADKGNRQICRFFYSEDSHTLTSNPISSSFLDYTKVRRPVDIELSDDEEYLYVCDNETKSIKKFDLWGNLELEFTGDATYTLNSPLFIEPLDGFINVIDKANDGSYNFVCMFDEDNMYSLPPGTIKYMVQFPSGSVPTDLSETWDQRMIVPDNGNNVIHSFNSVGAYLCSFNGNLSLGSSDFSSLGRVPTIYDAPGNYVFPQNLIAEFWGAQSGLKKYAEGADLFDLKYRGYDETYEYFSFSLTATNLLNFDSEIIRVSDNQVVATNQGHIYAGDQFHTVSFENTGIAYGNYKFRFTYTPYQNDSYGSYSVSPITKEIEFYYGSIWSGNITITNNVIINSGTTLTIAAGANITFTNNSKLEILGSLVVNGTSSNVVAMNFSSISADNGIKINSIGNANINYAEITNAKYGVYSESDDVTITNSEIANCENGIYLLNTNAILDEPLISNNLIHHNSSAGIRTFNSSAKILSNNIYSNSYGVSANSNSDLHLGTSSTIPISDGHNRIQQNSSYGILSSGSSYIFAGWRSARGDHGGYNIIASNGNFNAVTETSGSIKAECNWWGNNPPITSKFLAYGGEIDYTPYLTSMPVFKIASTSSDLIATNSLSSTYNKDGSLLEKLVYVHELLVKSENRAAAKICNDIIKNNPDESLASVALNYLYKASINEEKELFKNSLIIFKNKKNNKRLYANAGILLASMSLGDEKLSILDEVIEKYKNWDAVKITALYNKFIYYFHSKNDFDKAKEIADLISQNSPDSYLAIDVQSVLYGSSKSSKDVIRKDLMAEQSNDFRLFDNHPNPFNPTTTISYQIPEVGFVTLKIYDMLGKEVASLVNEKQNIGKYSVNFNAGNLASGVYIYRIAVQSFEGSQSHFTKTSKMLLLK